MDEHFICRHRVEVCERQLAIMQRNQEHLLVLVSQNAETVRLYRIVVWVMFLAGFSFGGAAGVLLGCDLGW